MKYKKRTIATVIIVLLLVVTLLAVKPYYDFLTHDLRISPLKALVSLDSIKKVDDSVNILILGIAGGSHDGPNLSDTIIVANYDFKKNRVLTISIPRDVWSDTLRDKVNSAYAYGEAKVAGGGLKLAKAEAAAIVGMPIQYSAVINFSGFEQLIDDVAGIDVEVEKSFTDKKFPLEGRENDLCGGDSEYKCRFETVSFVKGKQHMDGKTALKYVRSRNAIGEEGSDFARGKREQQVILALKTEFINTVKTFNLSKTKKLYEALNSLISRDISNQQVAILARKMIFKKGFYLKNFHLSDNFFIVPNYRLYDGKYVLIPAPIKSGPADQDFSTIHKYVGCLTDKADEQPCLGLVKKGD